MSEDISYLLTDEFANFSQGIRNIHERKKMLKEEFQEYKDNLKKQFEELDNEAKNLDKDFNLWKMSLKKLQTKESV